MKQEEIKELENNKKKFPVLTIISLSLLLVRILTIIITMVFDLNHGIISILFILPFLSTSLVLAIVSRTINKDIWSIVIIVIDILLYVLFIVGVIWFAIAFNEFFKCTFRETEHLITNLQ